MNNPLVSIQVVVRNGQDYIRHCLRAAMAQTYQDLEIIVLDNASTDQTPTIVSNEFPNIHCIRHGPNIGMWPGHEYLLAHTSGKYILALSTDVMLDEDFIKNAVAAMERDQCTGALQCKMYRFEKSRLESGAYRSGRIIDTCGFAVARSRRVVNIGHGEKDGPAFSMPREIFAVEGAAPFLRRTALEDIRIEGKIADPDFFWYGDDLDLAWRMRLFGWGQFFTPDMIAWHDRSTTKDLAERFLGHITVRRAARASIPVGKRILDWTNVRCTIVKNDHIMNVLRDAPWFVAREIAVFFYSLLFEPRVLKGIPRFVHLLPRMLRRRKAIMARAKVPASGIHAWFL